jgi:hypothetical protein
MLHSVLEPAGIQAARILSLWHLTLLLCTLVFAATLARGARTRGRSRCRT